MKKEVDAECTSIIAEGKCERNKRRTCARICRDRFAVFGPFAAIALIASSLALTQCTSKKTRSDPKSLIGLLGKELPNRSRIEREIKAIDAEIREHPERAEKFKDRQAALQKELRASNVAIGKELAEVASGILSGAVAGARTPVISHSTLT